MNIYIYKKKKMNICIHMYIHVYTYKYIHQLANLGNSGVTQIQRTKICAPLRQFLILRLLGIDRIMPKCDHILL